VDGICLIDGRQFAVEVFAQASHPLRQALLLVRVIRPALTEEHSMEVDGSAASATARLQGRPAEWWVRVTATDGRMFETERQPCG
jgi:nitrogen fixation protein FixH